MKYKGLGSSKVSGMKVLPFCLITLLLFLLSGCIEEYEADISSDDTDLLVVEGTICSSKMNKFILSHTLAINSQDNPQIVTGARVSVRGSDGSEYMTTPSYGYYSCWIDALDPDVEYYLHIETDGEVYESEPQKPIRTEEIADVTAVQNTPESNIDVLITPEAPFESNEANYYSWTYDETWEVHPDYSTYMYFDTEKKEPVYVFDLFPRYGWKDASSSSIIIGASSNYEGQHIQRLKLYDIDRSNERIYHKYSALVHQRAISKAEYEYELARRQASSEMGGLFTPLPSALPTNIHCLTSNKRVIGFVGCSSNTSEHRVYLKAENFSVYRVAKPDGRLWLDDCNEDDCCQMVERGFYLCEWLDERMMDGGTLRTAWARIQQLDVRYMGAHTDEPDYWNNEYWR